MSALYLLSGGVENLDYIYSLQQSDVNDSTLNTATNRVKDASGKRKETTKTKGKREKPKKLQIP